MAEDNSIDPITNLENDKPKKKVYTSKSLQEKGISKGSISGSEGQYNYDTSKYLEAIDIDSLVGPEAPGNYKISPLKINDIRPSKGYLYHENEYSKAIKKAVQERKDFLSENQSTLDRWGNGVVRLASKIGTELLKIPGYLGGIGVAIAEGDFTKIGDNAWVNAFEDMHEWTKQGTPIYGYHLEGKPLIQQLGSASFWADDFLDGVGFMASMLAPGAALKAAGVGSKIGRAIGAGSKFAKRADLAGATILNTYIESAAEMKGVVDNLKPQLQAMVDSGEISQSEADARLKAAGRNTFFANSLLLLGPNLFTNSIVLGKVDDVIGSRKINKIGQRAAQKIAGDTPEQILSRSQRVMNSFKKVGRAGKDLGKGVLSEGFIEEGGQMAIEEAAIQEGLTGEGFDIANMLDIYLDGLGETETQKAIFIGSLLGGGMGTYGGIRERKYENEQTERLATIFADRVTSFTDNFNQIFKTEEITDAEGNTTKQVKFDKHGKPIIDYNKLADSTLQLGNDTVALGQLQYFDRIGDKDSYKQLFAHMFTKFALPYVQQKGGLKLLEEHLNMVATKAKDYGDNTMEAALQDESYRRDLISEAQAIAKDVDRLQLYGQDYFKFPLEVGQESMAEEFVGNLQNEYIAKKAELRAINKSLEALDSAERELQVEVDKKIGDTIDIGDNYATGIAEEDKLLRKEIDKQRKDLLERKEKLNKDTKSILSKKAQKELFNAFVDRKTNLEEADVRSNTEAGTLYKDSTGTEWAVVPTTSGKYKLQTKDAEGNYTSEGETQEFTPAELNEYLKSNKFTKSGIDESLSQQEGERDLNIKQKKRLKKKLDSIESPFELINYYNQDIKPLNLKADSDIASYVKERFFELTGKSIESLDEVNRYSDPVKLVANDEMGTDATAVRDYNYTDRYYVKEGKKQVKSPTGKDYFTYRELITLYTPETAKKANTLARMLTRATTLGAIDEVIDHIKRIYGSPTDQELALYESGKGKAELAELPRRALLWGMAMERYKLLLEKKQEGIATLEKGLKDRGKNFNRLAKEAKKQEAQLNKAIQDLGFYEEYLKEEDGRTKEAAEVRKLISDTKALIADLRTEITNKQNQLQVLKDEILTLRTEIENLENSNDVTVNQRYRALRDEVRKERAERHRYDINRLETHLFYTKQEIDYLENTIEALENKVKVLEEAVAKSRANTFTQALASTSKAFQEKYPELTEAFNAIQNAPNTSQRMKARKKYFDLLNEHQKNAEFLADQEMLDFVQELSDKQRAEVEKVEGEIRLAREQLAELRDKYKKQITKQNALEEAIKKAERLEELEQRFRIFDRILYGDGKANKGLAYDYKKAKQKEAFTTSTKAKQSKEKSPAEEVHFNGKNEDTGTNSEIDSNKKGSTGSDTAFASKRPIEMFTKGLASSQVDKDGNLIDLPHIKRYYKFLDDNNVEDYKVTLVYSDGGKFGSLLTAQDLEVEKSLVDKNGKIARTLVAVVTKDGKPVGVDGKVISDNEVGSKGVYSFISFNVSSENFGDRFFTQGTNEEIEQDRLQAKADNTAFRKDVMEQLDAGKEVSINVTGKSRGVPQYNKTEEGPIPLTNIFDAAGNNNLDNFEVYVSTSTDNKLYIAGQSINTKPGYTYVYDKKSGNVYTLDTKKITSKDIDNIVNIFKYYVKNLKTKESGGAISIEDFSSVINGGVIVDPDSRRTAALIPNSSISMFKYLSDLIFWTGNNLDEKGNPINKSNKTAFHFVNDNKSPVGAVRLGISTQEGVDDTFPIGTLVDGEIEWNEDFEVALRAFLKDRHYNVKSAALKPDADGNVKDFVYIESIDEDGNVKLVDYSGEDGGYKKFLLTGNIAGTKVIAKNKVPSGDTQFRNKYLIIDASTSGIKTKPAETKSTKKKSDSTGEIISLSKSFSSLKQEGYARVDVEAANGMIIPVDLSGNTPTLHSSYTGERKEALAKGIEKLEPEINLESLKFKSAKGFKSVGTNILDALGKTPPQEDATNTEDDFDLGDNETLDDLDNQEFNRPIGEDFDGPEDFPGIQEWFQKNLPQVDLTVRGQIFGSNRYGYYSNAAVTLFGNAEVGTGYHEAFHAVSDLFLTKEEQKKLYDEWRANNNSTLSDDLVEEEIAEEFRLWKLGKPISSIKGAKQRNLFQRIWDTLLSLFITPDITIEEVFTRLETGYYATATPLKSDMVTRNRKIGKDADRTQKFTQEVLESVNYYYFDHYRKMGMNFDSLFNGDLTLEDNAKIYEQVKVDFNTQRVKYGKRRNVLRKLIEGSINVEKAKEIGLTSVEIKNSKTKEAEYTRLIDSLSYVLDNFSSGENSVMNLHNRYLVSVMKIEAPSMDIFNEDENEAVDSTRLWAESSVKISAKKNANRQVKLLLATLPKLEIKTNKDGVRAPQYTTNSLGLKSSVNFGETFSLLINKLQNITSITEMDEVLEKYQMLHPSIPAVRKYFQTSIEDASALDFTDLNTLIQFNQSFAKQKNNYKLSIIDVGAYVTVDSHAQYQKTKILNAWKNSNPDNYITNSKGDRVLNPKLKFNVPTNPLEAIKELARIGVKYSGLDYSNLKESDIKNLLLRGNITSTAFVDKTKQLFTAINQGKVSNPFNQMLNEITTKGDVNTLVKLEANTTVSNIENQHINVDGERVFGATLNNFISILVNDINRVNTREELFELHPQLKGTYSKNSILLKEDGKLFDKDGKKRSNSEVKFQILEAVKEANGRGSRFSKLSDTDRWMQQINEGLNGTYVFLRAADNALERAFSFGSKKLYKETDILSNKHLDDLVNYLEDEMNFATSNIGEWKNLNNALNYKGLLLDMVKDYNSKLYNTLVERHKKYSAKDILKEKDINAQVKEIFKKFLDEQLTKFIGTKNNPGILEKNLLIRVNENDKIDSTGLGIDVKTMTELIPLMRQYVIEDIVANIEQTKLFTGHPAAYGSIENFIKRMSGLTGTKKILSTDPKISTAINNNLKRTDGKKSEESINSTLKTMVFADAQVKSRFYDKYVELLGDAAAPYADMTEADAQGYISLDEYRETMFRSGDWTMPLEALYQWEIQKGWKGNRVTFPNTSFYGEKQGQEITPKDFKGTILNPLKLQHFGPMATEELVPGFYKLSVMPLIPSVYDGFSNLEALANKMNELQVGITVFESGNKVGTKLTDGVVRSIYTNGQPSIDLLNERDVQTTYHKYWGIQLDTGTKSKTKVVNATQIAKQILTNLYENGKPKAMRFVTDYKKGTYSEKSSEETEKRVKEYIDLTAKRIEIGLKDLINELGIKEKDGSYKIDDISEFKNILRKEAIEREMPDNIIKSIDSMDEFFGTDSLPNREKIENILMSIADSRTISRKRHGGAKIQGAPTLFEVEVTRNYSDGVLDSSDLNFYINEEGNVQQMEIYLPHYFKELGDNIDINNIDPELLENIIGFRIPTQGLISIESIKIKGFLPQSAGDLIVMPSEIVAKAGSDYDIDKLNLFLPNYEMVKGKPVYIEYLKGDNKLDERYNRYKRKSLEKINARLLKEDSGYIALQEQLKKFKKEQKTAYRERKALSNKEELADLYAYRRALNVKVENELATPSEVGLLKFLEETLEGLSQEAKEAWEKERQAVDYVRLYNSKVEALRDKLSTKQEKLLTKEEFAKLSEAEQNGIEALDNRMNELMKDFVMSPDNYKDLVTPIDANELKDAALRVEWLRDKKTSVPTLETLRKEDKNRIKAIPSYSILKRDYLMGVTKQNLTSKSLVGISALQATNNIISQLDGLEIAQVLNIGKETINTTINLQGAQYNPQNGNLILSRQKNADGQDIAQLLSQIINAAVDAAKDPFLLRANISESTANTFMYLIRAGIPLNTVVAFMNQPAIVKYVELQGIYESHTAEALNRKKFKNDIKKQIYEDLGINEKYSFTEKLTQKNLEEQIKNGGKNTDMQGKVLEDFLRYMEAAKVLSQGIRATTYDTKSSKNTNEIIYRVAETNQVINSNNLPNYRKSFAEGGFFAPHFKVVKEIEKIANAVQGKLTTFPSYKERLDELVAKYVSPYSSTPKADAIKVMDRFKADFITYVLNNSTYSMHSISRINEGEKSRLFQGTGSLPKVIALMKDEIKDSILLDYLEPTLNADTVENIDGLKIRSGAIDSSVKDAITSEWLEWYQGADEDFRRVAVELAQFVLLQSGLQNSPINFYDLIPVEIYSKMITETSIEFLDSNDTLNKFAVDFYLNNWDNEAIVPTARITMTGKIMYPEVVYPFYKLKTINPLYLAAKTLEESTLLRQQGVPYYLAPTVYSNPRYDGPLKPFIETDYQGKAQRKGIKDFRNNVSLIQYGESLIGVNTITPSKKSDTYTTERTENNVLVSTLISREEWNSMPPKEQEKFKECN